jgi:hypothetical protein
MENNSSLDCESCNHIFNKTPCDYNQEKMQDGDWDKLLNVTEDKSEQYSKIKHIMQNMINSSRINVEFSPMLEFEPTTNIPNLNLNEATQRPIKSHSNYCNDCQIAYLYNSDSTCMFCPNCGEEKEIISDDEPIKNINVNHNTSGNAFIPFKIIGKNSYCLQKSFLKCCADYQTYRNNSNKKDIFNHIYQYKGNKIPKDVLQDAVNLYRKIKDAGHVYRGNGKKGIIGACLFYACIMKNITKTPREIALVLGIEERFLSQGDRILQELNEKKVINIPTLLRPLEDYLNQYFPALGIDKKYLNFVIDLIKIAEKKNIHICADSRTTTKCVGATYMLISRIPGLRDHISKDDIMRECKISKSTFIRYYNLLYENHAKIKHVFKKHHIPMPIEWRFNQHSPIDKIDQNHNLDNISMHERNTSDYSDSIVTKRKYVRKIKK